MISEWLIDNLVCPVDQDPVALKTATSEIHCPHGHRYPVIDGIPVMLQDDPKAVTWNATASVLQAQAWNGNGEFELRGHHVLAARTAVGMTLPQFVERFGSSVSLWQAYEQGETTAPDGKPPVLPAESIEPIKEFVAEVFGLNSHPATEPTPSGTIDPWVQQIIAGTSGYLYSHLIGKLAEYPIPELRLPEGSGARLLDVGCNWGRWSISAMRKGYNVVGLDPSLSAVRAARRVARQLDVEPLLVVGDGRCLPFASASFSVVFSYSVLQHLSKENACTALAEIGRVLQPGGKALIQMPNAFGVRSLQHQAKRRFRTPRGFQVRYWTCGELKRAFTERIGRSKIYVDGYFGLGVQPSDMRLFKAHHKPLVVASECLRKMSGYLPIMCSVADSVYVESVR
jgi:SAM-dependent methyltransferase/uncharacterized protein YbaR (Trm112 family)